MYSLFTYAGTLAVWKMRYCSAGYERCERFRTAKIGRPVAQNLMPNGQLLRKPNVSPTGTHGVPR